MILSYILLQSNTSNPSDTIAGGLDESGVNAVILTCASPLSGFTSYIGPFPGTGTVGEWSEYAMCPSETFVIGFWLQISEDLVSKRRFRTTPKMSLRRYLIVYIYK